MEYAHHILIVEDNAEDRVVYQRYLKKMFGDTLKITMVDTGDAALNCLSAGGVDCVLLDYNLPDIDGVQFLEKRNEQSPNVPVVMLTGEGSEKIAVQALKLGAYDYLIKSELQPEHMHSTITNAIERASLKEKVKAQDAEIEYMAYHDSLTGLPNRVYFDKAVQQALARIRRQDKGIAILMIDLDGFKNVNDTLGHEAGDILLHRVTGRFLSVLRETDTLTRLGGDEFVLIVDNVQDPKDVAGVAHKLIRSLEGPFFIHGSKTNVSASVGIATYPDGGKTPSDLLRNADMALYEAKEAGRKTYRYFSEALNQQVIERMHLENALRDALDRDEITPCFQPIFNLDNHDLFGVEVLLRWRNKNFVVPVEKLIGVLEDTGLIVAVGYTMIEKALQCYNEWCANGHEMSHVAINLSPKQLNHEHWEDSIQKLIKQYKVDPKNVVFELTESAILSDVDAARVSLTKLHDMGAQIFIDDFGTGYSSLSLIRNLPISGLKIDQSFVKDIQDTNSDVSLITSVLVFADSLNLTVVAEGIETEQQLSFLSQRKHHKGQGFYLAKPMFHDEFQKWLKQRSR